MSMANPGDTPDKITYFAETDYRSKRIKFGIRDEDRARHMYIIGKTGMGKSTLLENLAIQDIQNGEGICFIDPHGGTAETLLSYVPEHRMKDVIYFAPFDIQYPVAMNVLEDIGADKRGLVASGLMGAFKKVWVDAWSARMEYLLNNALLALLEFPGSTLLGVNRIFADKNYRTMVVNNVTDPSVRAFWVDEFAKYSDKFATEATAAIQNKVGQFAANPLIRNMIGQPKSTFDIRQVMDERKILIVNLSKGRMGEGNANLVGSMLITKIYLAAMSRADVGPEAVKGLPPFYLYVDEFQSFANESFADILSEARKYKLSLTVAHQYVEQMSDEVRAAVFGNVGTMISFRVGAYDAEVFEKEFAPAFTAEDMVNLGFAQIYLKLMIRGVGSQPFSATTLNRPKMPVVNFASQTIALSREQFARPRADVEEEIKKWHEPIPDAPRDPNAAPIPETRKFAPGMRPVRPAGASASYSGAPSPIVVPLRDVAASPSISPAAPAPSPVSAPPPVTAAQPRVETRVEPRVEHRAEHRVESLPPRAPVEEATTMPAATPAPSGRPAPQAVHRPFAAELSKLATPEAVASVPTRPHAPRAFTPPQKSERPTPPPRLEPVSLSSLKMSPKKDKGPSTENLSSLRAVLEASLAPKNDPQPPTQTAQTPQRNAEKTELPKTAVLPPAKPRSLLEEIPERQTPNEVPEEVLKNLLSD